MEYEQLKNYLYIIQDMEKNIYIQQKTLENLNDELNLMEIKGEIEKPVHYQAESDYLEYMIRTGVVCAVIGFVIGLFARWGEFWDSSGIFGPFLSILYGLFIALIAGFGGALLIGPFVALVFKRKYQNEYDVEYENKLRDYAQIKKDAEEREKQESIIRENLRLQIKEFKRKYEESQARLESFYSLNIIIPKYRHDIVAISAFYQYFLEKRTYCLEFDRETGDRGAYNLYNEEMQRGVIISKLSQVLDKLDEIIDNQKNLYNVMVEANRKIDYLSDSIHQATHRITSAIEDQTAIQEYHAERIEAELGFMNTLSVLDHMSR